MKYLLAVFDMDGTILDTLDDLTDTLNMSLAEVGMPVRTKDEVRSFVGNGVGKLIERALPEIVYKLFDFRIKGLMENPDTRFGAIVFYNIWVGFGVNVLMYTNAMSGISSEVLESARLDGATGIREFWFISLPLIYPTMTTFLITSFATMFTNQYNIYSFYGGSVPSGIASFGYWLFNETEQASSRAEYSIISAIGLLLTCIALPLTLFIRRLLNRFDPSEGGAQ